MRPLYDLAPGPGDEDVTIYGRGINEELTRDGSMAVGDFNGDGFADLALGAWQASTASGARADAGEAYLFLGGRHLPEVRDTAGTAGVFPDMIVAGAATSSHLTANRALAFADVNGDGLDDLLVGSPNDSGADSQTTPNAGAVYVILGRTNVPLVVDLAAGDQDVTLLGGRDESLTRGGLGSADLNGDGLQDIIIGSPFAGSSVSPNRGVVYVALGRQSFPAVLDLPNGGADLTIRGAEANDRLTFGGFAAGDVSGDGCDDLVVPANTADGPDNARPDAGEIYVIEGHAGLPPAVDLANGEEDSVIYIASPQDNYTSNMSVAVVALNGDGYADIVIGQPHGDGPGNTRPDAGEVYVVFGRDVLPRSVDIAQNEQSLIIYGRAASDRLCESNPPRGADIDGDGVQDLILAAPFADDPGSSGPDSGAVYVICGRSGFPASVDLASHQNEVTIFGAKPTNSISYQGALTTGDLNGDGVEDLAIGTAMATDGPTGRRDSGGRAYIVFGGRDLPPTINLSANMQDVLICGAEPMDNLTRDGALLAGDLNGDGADDLLLGASFADGPSNTRAEAGEAYVIFGAKATLERIIDGLLGRSDEHLDVNGDGLFDAADLIWQMRQGSGL